MTLIHSRLHVIVILISLLSIQAIQAAPYDGKVINYSQPGLGKISLRVVGSTYYARTETLDGYTVVYHPQDQSYYYARLDEKGDTLLPTNLKVGTDLPMNLTKGLEINPTSREAIWRANYNQINKDSIQRWQQKVKSAQQSRTTQGESISRDSPVASEAHVIGDKKGLTILVQFPDDPRTAANDPTNFPTGRAKIERFCNEIGYAENGNAGSVRDYFTDQSIGLVDYTMLVTPIITLPNPRSYYNFSDYSPDPDVAANTQLRGIVAAATLIINDAVDILNAQGFVFSGLTLNENQGDNEDQDHILSTNIIFAGSDSGVGGRGLWPHRSAIASKPEVTINSNPTYVYDYQITSLPNSAPVLDVFVHESAHLLCDFPDLYDRDFSSRGIGQHGLMATGLYVDGGRTPTPINLYHKDVVGWANITDVSFDNGIFAASLAYLPTTGNVGYRFTNPDSPTEHFIVENRGDGDPWAEFAPAKGILIWHVDEAVTSSNDYEDMTFNRHYEISLVQKDGDFDLENDVNSGDSGDAYRTPEELFSDTTAPNANWWNGSPSGIKIRIKDSAAPTMEVEFGVLDFVIVRTPNGGRSLARGTQTELTWRGDFPGAVNIDLYKGGVFLRSIAANEPNDGSYDWTVDASLVVADDYRIRITSVLDTSDTDESDGDFAINQESLIGSVIPNGWQKSNDAEKSWIVSTDFSTNGIYSLTSEDITDNETAEIEYTGAFEAGLVRFDVKVSSETEYDFFRFYIDGNKQEELSGDLGWRELSFPVTPGTHTFTWSYSKDVSFSSDPDRAWIDNVVLPTETISGIALWRNTEFGANSSNPLIAGDDADPDGDGFVNMLEYALGMNPQSPNDRLGMDLDGTETTVSIRYPINLEATDIRVVVEGSNDLMADSWGEAPVIEQVLSTSGNIDTIEATMTVDDDDVGYFLRLRIEYK